MFDKRLMQLVPGVVPYIIASVVAKVIALLMNVLVILSLGGLFGAMGTVALVARAGLLRAVPGAACGCHPRARHRHLPGPARGRSRRLPGKADHSPACVR